MIQHVFNYSGLVETMKVGVYYNQKFRANVLPRIASTVERPIVYGHVKRVLEMQGFDTKPEIDNKSIYNPDDLFQALSRYIPTPLTEIDKVSLTHAFRRAERAFGRPEGRSYLTPLSFDMVQSVVKEAKSSGAPNYESKKAALPVDVERARRIVDGLRAPDPCTAWHRISHGDEGPKLRLVWGYPLSMTLIEGRFAYPLIQTYLNEVSSPMMFGSPKLITAVRTLPIANSNFVAGFDYSKFDASVKPFLIRMAFKIIRSWFPRTYWRILDIVENYFIYTRIVMPDGNIYQKTTGIPSGSFFTQIVDSIVNYISIQYVNLRVTGKTVSDRRILVLGDDSLLGLNHRIKFEDYAKAAAELGLEMSVSKSVLVRNGEPYHFLGHQWDKMLVSRPPLDLAKRMIYPESMDLHNTGALQRIGDFLADAKEAWPILWRAFCHKYGCNAHVLKPVECVINVGAASGLTRYVLEELGVRVRCTPWTYVTTSILH